MAYVGTITVAVDEAEPLQTRSYAAPAHEGPERSKSSRVPRAICDV
jgi:hypothetical protein